jgi:replicative DNA helicase
MDDLYAKMQREALEAGDHTYKVSASHSKVAKRNEETISALAPLYGPIPEGQRNVAMMRLAGVLRKQGMDEYLLRHLLLSINRGNNIGLPENEIKSIAKSAARYSPSQIENSDSTPPSHGLVRIDQVISDTISFMQRVRDGKQKLVTTGIEWFDSEFGGIMPGEMIVIGARASVGKSAFGMQVAFGCASQDIPTAYFSLEMSRISLFARRGFKGTGMSFGEYLKKKGKDISPSVMKKFQTNASEDACHPLYISETAGLTIPRIREELLMAHEDFKPECIVIDHLHLMQTEDNNSSYYNKLTSISNALKELAIELNVPVFVLAQLNRSSDKEEREPSDHDLRDSGAIEQDADRVVLLHRPHRSTNEWIGHEKDPAIVIVKKNRNMGPAKIKCWFTKATMEFIPREPNDNYKDDTWEVTKKGAAPPVPIPKSDSDGGWGVDYSNN